MHLPENRLLSTLPQADLTRLLARMANVTFGHRELLYQAGGPIDYVYFPLSGVLSAVIVMADGQSAETAATGREGMVGAAAFLGALNSTEQVFCQVHPAECRKFPAVEFAKEVARGGAFQKVVYRYLRGVLVASGRQTACNALHSIDERCARWLLMSHDGAGTDEFPLTHEFLSTMLGVRRATVTVSAASLQSAGLITYRHGRVKVLNREGLEEVTCECYKHIREAFEIVSI
jgi:CRP-like cAMP-binding protein